MMITAKKVFNFLNNCDIRTLLDDRNEKIGKKIRDNELKKIPYLIIVGEKELESNSVAVRRQGEGDKGTMKLNEFVSFIENEIKEQLKAL